MALTIVVTPAPAQAAVSGSASASDLTLRNTCQRHPIDYTVTVGPGTTHWKLKITVFAPGGGKSEGFDLSSSSQSPTEGTVHYFICGSSTPGAYTILGQGSYQTVPAVNLPMEFPDSTFTVRRTQTRTKVQTTQVNRNTFRLVAKVKAHRARGYRPLNGASVVFQRRVEGKWRKVHGSRTFTDHGVAKYVVKAPRGSKIRAVTRQSGYLAGSVSAAKRLR